MSKKENHVHSESCNHNTDKKVTSVILKEPANGPQAIEEKNKKRQARNKRKAAGKVTNQHAPKRVNAARRVRTAKRKGLVKNTTKVIVATPKRTTRTKVVASNTMRPRTARRQLAKLTKRETVLGNKQKIGAKDIANPKMEIKTMNRKPVTKVKMVAKQNVGKKRLAKTIVKVKAVKAIVAVNAAKTSKKK